MAELARYQDGPASVVISRDGAQLVFRTQGGEASSVSEWRMPVDDFVARGPGPWPWYDLGVGRIGALRVLSALGVEPPAWTEPLRPDVMDLFRRAHRGDSAVIELLAMGADPDPVDACGASPLWYAVRTLASGIAVALIDAGADAGRRIALSAGGERFTTILHEIVRAGRTVALNHALANGVDPALRDSDGATPMHVIEGPASGGLLDGDNPEMVRALARAGASVSAALPDGTQPIEQAARRLLPATVAALVDLGAEPGRGLDALLAWWATAVAVSAARAEAVANVVDVLRAGGAEVTERHRALAVAAGVEQVMAALRR
ncbi:ankyrin repeat domain-containing protein [Mycolicibacterium sp. GF69]|uniref:ankyrin repeat domain-containing protein n=1 Tax=Mycolicibacterium sp. GF69 TaxID=2267251 RepID=UPI000DCCE09C|nr:ankyrin repeat domain-containing protein [Mycolicibacterium sp. GF69]RAV09804.1 ankyrin repeat domain-containing protein [Mycolicibacterium sp. GF69]